MELSPSQTFISVGGQEHDLELFNIEDHKSYFKGKNLPHDKLDMRIPICLNCQTVFYNILSSIYQMMIQMHKY